MVETPWLEGEPECLTAAAADLDTYKATLEKLGPKAPFWLTFLVKTLNEAAFIAGVMYERAAVIALSQDNGEHPPFPLVGTCTIPNQEAGFPDHECGVTGTCNGFPREHKH